ncbi:MAG TPA: tetratricopeptide repeat protein [Bryobacteraceae bacterium]|nr:tetratricopeptide repeat protein [Bryobacteraceae bacterium]
MDAAARAARGLLILAIAGAAAADDFQNGAESALAGRWEEARAAFLKGQRAAPRDKRFPLELAGVEYRLKNFREAKRDLRRALRLDPGDRYGNDFLGTIYFLEGNLEASLRYWNRIGKPRIADVTVSPEPRVDPVLLDSALTFSPASVLTADELRTSEARLDALEVFPSYRFDLAAHPEESFDATIHWLQLPAWMEIASAFRGVPYQTVTPQVRNIGGSGISADALLRWDAQKRRAGVSLAGPVHHNAQWRYGWYADGRSETWSAGAPEDFRLRRLASGVEIQAIPNWRLQWRMGAEVSSRHFANLPGFRGGTALEYRASINYELLRIPEHRLTVSSGVTASFGRMFSRTNNLYAQGQASLRARWLPQARGDDYEVNARLRAGTTQGGAPFDELFQVGVERDNNLWLRGHAGTIDGKKGSAPIGRNYVLANWDLQKHLYRRGIFTLAGGPFLDTGRINDTFRRDRFGHWMVDTGLEASVRLAGAFRITLIYGRDLRGGGRVVYATAGQ